MKKTIFRITGMTCGSCEVRIERKWRDLPGVQKAHVNHASGKAIVEHDESLEIKELQKAIEADGYKVSPWDTPLPATPEGENDWMDYLEIGAIFVGLYMLYKIVSSTGLVPTGFGLEGAMSYWFVLGVGLIAAFSSCMAVTGGLLLAISSRYNERHPEFTNWQKFKPQLYFNAGRVIFYGLLGGLVGLLGSAFTLSTRFNAFIMIAAGLVMLILGFQLLHIFPGFSRFLPKMPKGLAHKIHSFEKHDHPLAPFLLGGATFFLPCGFTQALQLYVLAQGSWKVGALTMFIFALGTLPALLSISALSSFVKGAVKHYFFRVAGTLVVLVALLNLQSGLVLAGFNLNLGGTPSINSDEANVEVVDGKQIAKMKIVGLEFIPANFTVIKGQPVEWQIDASRATGCAQFIVANQIGVAELLPSSGIKTITFTPEKTGKIYFSCSMGMTTPGAAFNVIEKL